MYLSVQNTTLTLGPSEKAVLITTPMFSKADQSVKVSRVLVVRILLLTKLLFQMYCATYDSNATTPSPLSSEPCTHNHASLDNSTTASSASQLFSWNTESGEITPLWRRDAIRPLVDTTSAPGGASDPASQNASTMPNGQDDGFIVGGPAVATEASAGKVLMVFRAANSKSTATGLPDDQQSEDSDSSAPASDNGSASEDSNDKVDDGNSLAAQDANEDPAAAGQTSSLSPSASPLQETVQEKDATPTSSEIPIPTEPATQETSDPSPSSDASNSPSSAPNA